MPRKLKDDDSIPVLVRTGSKFAVVTQRASEAKVADSDGNVNVVVEEDNGRLKAATCLWAAVRISEDGDTCYDSPNSGRTVIAFAAGYPDALEYVATRPRGVGGKLKKDTLETGDRGLEGIIGSRANASQALKTGKGNAQDVKMATSALYAKWGNCGMASANLVQLLDAAAGLEEKSRNTEIRDHKAFEGAWTASLWKDSLLVDISLHNIHSFCLELTKDGGFLVQGYQGAYTAFWWEAITDEPFVLPGVKTDCEVLPEQWQEHRKQTTDHRNKWGSGNMLSRKRVETLLTGIGRIVEACPRGEWTRSAHDIFVSLPFYPGQSRDVTLGTVRSPQKDVGKEEKSITEKAPSLLAVDITISRIRDLSGARVEYQLDQKESLSRAILNRVYAEMEALSKHGQ